MINYVVLPIFAMNVLMEILLLIIVFNEQVTMLVRFGTPLNIWSMLVNFSTPKKR